MTVFINRLINLHSTMVRFIILDDSASKKDIGEFTFHYG